MIQIFYECDREKNTECPKTGCTMMKVCHSTTKKEYAKIDEFGHPVVSALQNLPDNEGRMPSTGTARKRRKRKRR